MTGNSQRDTQEAYTPDSNGRLEFGKSEHLLERLTKQNKAVVFLVGSGLTRKPTRLEQDEKKVTEFGVADTTEIVELIDEQLKEKTEPGTPVYRYQKAFDKLLIRRGPDSIRKILFKAVLRAWNGKPGLEEAIKDMDEQQMIKEQINMEQNVSDWHLPKGARALGAIIAEFPDRFGKYLLTTNFDPLLAISIRQAQGKVVQAALHRDNNPSLTLVQGCYLIHLHGYWYRDALHTPRQINQDRPHLREFLNDLIERYTIVVIGYGGWDDLFLNAITDVVNKQNAEPDILWIFHKNPDDSKDESAKKVLELLKPGIEHGRVALYSDINCNDFLPRLLRRLRTKNAPLFQDKIGLDYDPCKLPEQKEQREQKKSSEGLKQCGMERAICQEDLKDGVWLLLTPDGYRIMTKLESTDESKPPKGKLQEPKALFSDYRKSNDESPSEWEIKCEIQSMTWKLGYRTIEIPDILDAPFHWSVLKWEHKANKDQQHIPNNEDCIAIHVPYWSYSNKKEFSKEGALEGQWLKLSEDGGNYLVELYKDGTLTEKPLFKGIKTNTGRWKLKAKKLIFDFTAWKLTVSEENRDNGEWKPLFRCTEQEPGQERETTFYVAHIFPVWKFANDGK